MPSSSPKNRRDAFCRGSNTFQTPLFGRQEDLAALASIVEQHRLVSILGIGGTGKTGRKVVTELQQLGHNVRSGGRGTNPVFDWGDPQISHISYDTRPIIRCVLKWADSIARGKDYSRKAMTKANFVIGGTTAPPGRPSLKK